MAIAIVSSVSGGSTDGTQPFTTGSIDTTGATGLVVAMCIYVVTGDTVISDNKGNTYSHYAYYSDIANVPPAVQIWYCQNPTVGTGHTFTADAATHPTDFPSVAALALSGTHQSSLIDAENGGVKFPTGTSVQTGNVSPGFDDEIIVTALGVNSIGTGQSINGGFTIRESVAYQAAAHFGIQLAYLIQTSATAANPTWSWTGTDSAAVAIGTFKSSGSVTPGYLLVKN